MKKVINFVKKDNIFVFIFLLIITTTFAFCIKLDANDQLWNFSNIYKMSNDYVIYKDLNVIITPLYFYIGQLIFEIFGANYLIYSIYQNFIIYMMLFLLIYKLFRKININKINSIIYLMIIAVIVIFIMPVASYNILAIFFVLLGVFVLINKKKDNIINNFIQGMISFLVFFTKQNIGVFYFIAIIIGQVLTKKDKRILIKNITIQVLTQIILTLIMMLGMYINGNLYDFINFAFLGIGEFANENFSVHIKEIIINVSTFILSILSIILTYMKKIPFKEKEKNNIRILASMSTFNILISYPLMNIAHTIIGNIIFMIMIVYLLDIIIINQICERRKG